MNQQYKDKLLKSWLTQGPGPGSSHTCTSLFVKAGNQATFSGESAILSVSGDSFKGNVLCRNLASRTRSITHFLPLLSAIPISRDVYLKSIVRYTFFICHRNMASSMPFLGVILLCLCITTSSLYFDPSDQIELAHDYLRFADVNRHCHSVVSSAKELTYDSYLPNPCEARAIFPRQQRAEERRSPFAGPPVPRNTCDHACRGR